MQFEKIRVKQNEDISSKEISQKLSDTQKSSELKQLIKSVLFAKENKVKRNKKKSNKKVTFKKRKSVPKTNIKIKKWVKL